MSQNCPKNLKLMEPSMAKKNLPPEFIAQQIPRQGDIAGPLATRMVSVRLPVDIDAVVYSVPEKSAWLRRVITEAAQRELMKDGEV
jgi:hypothetical protein